jgi:hypothetical protein
LGLCYFICFGSTQPKLSGPNDSHHLFLAPYANDRRRDSRILQRPCDGNLARRYLMAKTNFAQEFNQPQVVREERAAMRSRVILPLNSPEYIGE